MQLAEYSHQHLLRASQRRQQAIEKIRQEYYMSMSSEATSQVYLFHRVQQIFISMGKQIARSSLYALYSRHEIPYSRSITRSSALSDALILTKVLNVVWFFLSSSFRHLFYSGCFRENCNSFILLTTSSPFFFQTKDWDIWWCRESSFFKEWLYKMRNTPSMRDESCFGDPLRSVK